MAVSLSLNDVEKRIFDKHNGSIIMSNYKTSSTDLADFKCLKCDRTWRDFPYKVYSSKGCSKCNRQKKYTYEEAVSMIKSKNGILLSKRYVNVKTKMKILYSKCGHINKISLSDFMRSDCYCMKYINLSNSVIEKTNKKIEKLFDSSILKLNSITRKEKIIYVDYFCPRGHNVKQQYNAFVKTKSCRDCNIIKKGMDSRIIKSYSWKNKKQLISSIRLIHEKWWREEIMKKDSYLCVITKKPFEEIHHLYPLIKIVDKGILQSKVNLNVKSVSQKDKKKVVKEIMKIHKKYSDGVCLTRKMHLLFHKIYGKSNFTPENFYEFFREMKKEVL